MKHRLKYILYVILILIVILVAIGIRIKLLENTENKEYESTSFETNAQLFGNEYAYAYADIEEIVHSKEYSRSNVAERIDMLTPVLEQLIQDGYIEEYIVYMNDTPPTVTVICVNGLSFGILLDDFSENQN